MKLNTGTGTVELRGDMEVLEYEVEMGPQLIQLLVNQYSDICWAIVRELGTNMLDAYEGLPPEYTPRPPELHLPTTLEPWLEFKDFGTGMSYEQVRDVYRKLNASTKRGDNIERGGFGIGAKVIYGYTGSDQAVIESRFRGERMVFTAFKQPDGTPALAHVGTVATDEPNGVTVRLPIAPNDFDAFKVAAKRLGTYFPMPLVITGDRSVTIEKPQYALQGTHWGVKRGSNANIVVMGGVPYPISVAQLAEHAGLGREYLMSMSFDFHVPIGAVDIVPSREALMYTPRTAACLKAAVVEFKREVTQYAQARLAQATTKWEALQLLHESWGMPVLQRALGQVTWHGQALSLVQGVSVTLGALQQAVPGITCERFKTGQRHLKREREVVVDPGYTFDVVPGAKTRVVLSDGARGYKGRVDAMLATEFERWHRVEVFVFQAPGLTAERLSELFSGVPVTETAKLPVPERVRIERERRRTQVKQFMGGGWSNTSVDPMAGGVYVRLEGSSVIDAPTPVDDSTLKGVLAGARLLGLLPQNTVLYGIPRSCKALERRPGWQHLWDILGPKLPPLLAQEQQALADIRAWDPTWHQALCAQLAATDASRLRPGTTPHTFVHALQRATARREELEGLVLLACTFQLPLPDPAAAIDPAALYEQLLKEYPLLPILVKEVGVSWRWKQYADQVMEYLAWTPPTP